MGLFSALGQVIAAPIRVVNTVCEDLSGKDEISTGLAIGTLGLSSVAKGIAKTAKRATEELG